MGKINKKIRSLAQKIYNQPEKLFYIPSKAGLFNWMSDENYIKWTYKIIYRRKLNLKKPTSYSEQLAWMKLYYSDELAKTVVNKFLVRDYVTKKIGEKYLLKNLGYWKSVNDIEFESLPNQFVLKPVTGTGTVEIVTDKSTANIEKIKNNLAKGIRDKFYQITREWVYRQQDHGVLAEELMIFDDISKMPNDFKFFCFNGEPKFMYMTSDRTKDDVNISFFDLDWNFIDVTIGGRKNNKKLSKPANFPAMVEIAKTLSEDFPMVRVDLYEYNDKIYFSELTFFPGGGFCKFEPDEIDYGFGQFLNLETLNKICKQDGKYAK